MWQPLKIVGQMLRGSAVREEDQVQQSAVLMPDSPDLLASQVMTWIAFQDPTRKAWEDDSLQRLLRLFPTLPMTDACDLLVQAGQGHAPSSSESESATAILRASYARRNAVQNAALALRNACVERKVTARGIRDGEIEPADIPWMTFLDRSVAITVLDRVQQHPNLMRWGINGGPGFGKVIFLTSEVVATWPAPDQPKIKRNGGRPRKYDWDAAKLKVMAYLDDEGEPFPGEQAKLEKFVSALFPGEEPSESSVRKYVTKWVAEFKAGKGP